MATFEQVFGIPSGHILKQVRFHQSNYDDAWTHEEYDPDGHLVARYKSWDSMPPRGAARSGWCKYGPDGALIEEHQELAL